MRSPSGRPARPFTIGLPGPRARAPAERATERDVAARERHYVELLDRGVHHALRHLNAATRYRFTTIFRVDAASLLGVARYDRENPAIHCMAPCLAPAACHHASDPVATCDAETGDATRAAWRRQGTRDLSTCRAVDVSECAIALRLAGGLVVGVLCHSDPRPRVVSRADVAALADAAPALARWLVDSRYDAR